jgi:hypothetical protein
MAAVACRTLDLAVVGAVVGGVNGAIAGARRMYDWRSIKGRLAFLLDSTWALATTAGALAAHIAAVLQRSPTNYVGELSERRNRHVYERGCTFRRGFMLTLGNVVNGAGADAHHRPARQRAVIRHENVHIWQARWFGPLFPLVYAVWWVLGALAAVVVWLVCRPSEGLGRLVDAWGYYRNPFEWWAYSREGRWPPPRAVKRFVWRRALVRPRESSESVSGRVGGPG